MGNRGIIDREGGAPVRTSPVFHAPVGKYDWLNKSLFLGSLRVDPAIQGAVFIRVYQVQ